MKKKILIVVVAVLVIVGGVVAYMAMTGGEVTEADQNKGKEVNENLGGQGGALEKPEEIEMPETNPVADSIESVLELEEFDPNDI